MKEVWIIVRDTGVCHGHGDYMNEPVLAYKGYDTGDIYPAFNSKEIAKEYINKNNIIGRPQKVKVEMI